LLAGYLTSGRRAWTAKGSQGGGRDDEVRDRRKRRRRRRTRRKNDTEVRVSKGSVWVWCGGGRRRWRDADGCSAAVVVRLQRNFQLQVSLEGPLLP
jgi:alkylated DNA repair dioxygenase AlkB